MKLCVRLGSAYLLKIHEAVDIFIWVRMGGAKQSLYPYYPC